MLVEMKLFETIILVRNICSIHTKLDWNKAYNRLHMKMRFWPTLTYDVNHVAECHPEYILDELHVCNPFQPLSGDLKQVIFWNSQTSRVRGENEGTTCEVKCQMNSMNHQRNGLIKVLKTILFFPEDKNKKLTYFIH